jgi:signal transduction histidine kinase
VLTGIRIRGLTEVPLKWTGLHGIELRAGQNDVEFEFAALSLRAAPIRYRHKLEGHDGEWSAATPNGQVRYASLAPGRYSFWVESLGADGTRSSQALASFEILPPIWRRWWFLTLAAAALAGLAYAAHLYRLRAAVELERVRMRIATDLHDELGADLSRLALLSETAQLDGGRPGALQRIAALSRQMLDATSDVVWAIRPQKDRLSDLVQRMREFANDLFAMDGVQISFQAPAGDARLDPEVRRQVFSVFKECLNNVARHSEASVVEVELGLAAGQLTLRVSDNGRGFLVEEAGAALKRHGVSGMRWRAGILKGALDVESRPGAGATVRLRIPLRK